MTLIKNDIKDAMDLGLTPQQVAGELNLPIKRADKIRELKFALKEAQAELQKFVSETKQDFPSETPKEEREKFLKEQGQKIAEMRAIVMALADELQNTRLNKYNSSFFSFTPSGPNRRMRRLFAKTKTMRFKKKA